LDCSVYNYNKEGITGGRDRKGEVQLQSETDLINYPDHPLEEVEESNT
jgi:hypothetical protein